MKCHFLPYFLACVLNYGIVNTAAQESNYLFNYVTNEQGISSNTIRAIYEDSFGFIWFGTKDGLNRYDGIQCEVYRSQEDDTLSLSNNAINCILEEPLTGNLWIGTVEGLNYFDRGRKTFTRYLVNEKGNSISNNYIYALAIDENNTLWIGTNYGLNTFCEGTFNHYLLTPNPENSAPNLKNSVKSILLEENIIWLGTGEKTTLFDKNAKRELPNNFPEDLRDVQYINRDSKGRIWFSSYSDGLFYKSIGSDEIRNIKQIIYFPERIKPQGIIEHQGKILLANRDMGLNIIDLDKKTIQLLQPDRYEFQSLNSMALVCLFKSRAGIIWIGTYDSGVNYYDARRKDFRLFKTNFRPEGLFNENIRSVFQDSEGNVWIGTKEKGALSKFLFNEGKFEHIMPDLSNPHALHGDYILCIDEYDADHLLVGTLRQGLNIYNKRTGTTLHRYAKSKEAKNSNSNAIFSLWVNSPNEVWLGTMEGLAIWNPLKDSMIFFNDLVNIRCFFKESENKIWVGTRWDGIYVFNNKYELIERYMHVFDDPNSLGSNEISSIKQGPDGKIWITTGGGGLNYYNPDTNGFIKIREKDGLANDYVCNILFYSDDEYWISTGNGLSRYYPKENRFRNYDKADGLQGNEFADYVGLRLSNGHLLFGGRNGFNYFKPENIRDNIEVPPVVLTEFYANNLPVKVGPNAPIKTSIEVAEKITLTHQEITFSLGFAALNYLSPEKNQYKYMLEGFDEEWIPIKKRPFVTYTNIPPGDYTFKVIASNNDGYWNEQGAAIAVDILPPWWKTLGFRILTVVFIVIIATFLFYGRIQYLTKRKLELEILVKNRTSELQKTVNELKETQLQLIQSEKMASIGILTAGVAHEINNPLNYIQSGIYGLENILSTETNGETLKNNFQQVIKTMQSGITRVSNIVKTLNTFSRKGTEEKQWVNIHEIIDNCLVIINHEIKNKCIVKKHYTTKLFQLLGNPENLHQVFINLLMNSVQSITSKGEISISTRLGKTLQQLEIIIADNGSGISSTNIEKIFDPFFTTKDPGNGTGLGLSIVYKIIQDHNGKISFTSDLNKGTTVTLSLPVNHFSGNFSL